ncbi:MAG: hypothetical protein LBB25_02235 [Holosporaceae bacterium]|jgi:hypothetical protein|nr:hypothetical protein [Holosporaceae bacterium]
MKQVLTSEEVNFLEEKLKSSSPAPWSIIEDEAVATVWVVPSGEGNPIALFDYRSREQNSADAHFFISARNYMDVMIREIKNLRKRILELIQSNNIEVQKRMDLQAELAELKKILRNEDGIN